MKKNKILFLVFVAVLLVSTMGCTTKPMRPNRTQTRIGMDGTSPRNTNLRPRTTNRVGIDNRNMDRVGLNDRNMNRVGIDNRNMDNVSGLGPSTTNGNLGTRNGVIETPMQMSDKARDIARKVTDLNEVNSASVLITGNTAVVGVNMKNNVEGKMTTALKQKIERTVRNADNNIKNVSITADPDLYTRISTMSTDIRNGKPISGFAREIQEILRRITPVK